jgi:predicted regulator of Ras-like GTPase activity (Roadblock/LC7/MglB family)
MKALLTELLDRLPGARGAAVVGLDGIAVEKVSAQPSFNMDLVSAEVVALVKRALSSGANGGDGLEEISVTSRSGLTILRSIGGDYYLCLVVGPDGIPGRARFEAWRVGRQLEHAVA